MKEENRVYMSDMRERLQSRMHYDHPENAFHVLLVCFGKYKKHKSGWAGSVLRQGWVTPYIAHEFAKYVGYPIDRN